MFRDLGGNSYAWAIRFRDTAGDLSAGASPACTSGREHDIDKDGVPDTWDLSCFGRLDYSDGTADPDKDGIGDLLEAEAATHSFAFRAGPLPGWSMTVLPCDTTLDPADHLAAAVDPTWVWNTTILRYADTTEPKAYQELWVFSDYEAHNTPVSGPPPDAATLQFSTSWNLSGSGLPATMENDEGLTDLRFWADGGYSTAPPAADPDPAFLQADWFCVSAPGCRDPLPLD